MSPTQNPHTGKVQPRARAQGWRAKKLLRPRGVRTEDQHLVDGPSGDPCQGAPSHQLGSEWAGGSTSVSCFHSEDWPASQAFQLLPVQKQGPHSPPLGLRGLGSLPAAKSFLEPLHRCLHQTPQALLSDDSGAEQPSVRKVQDPSSEGRPRGPRCQPAQGKPRRLLWT